MSGCDIRVGEGWDVHQLVAGRKLILGGVEVPHATGLLGHSDADVLLHAITDALLGAAGLGDIGRHFPDTDPQFRGADSSVLLAEAARRVRAAGWEIGNVDISLGGKRLASPEARQCLARRRNPCTRRRSTPSTRRVAAIVNWGGNTVNRRRARSRPTSK